MEFWHTHSVTDYEDLMEDVPGPLLVRKNTVKVPLKPAEEKAVTKLAEAKGLSSDELIHRWVAEKIARPQKTKRTQ